MSLKNIYIILKSKYIIYSSTLFKNNSIKKSKLIGSIGKLENVYVYNSILSGIIEIKTGVKIVSSELFGNIVIGRNSTIWGPNSNIYSGKKKVIIGKFCSIARNVSIQCYNHNIKKITTYYIGSNFFNEEWENENVYKGDIVINNDVWIGAHSLIMPGVTIGNGAVIAANSVVTKDVPDYTIVAGSPAIVIKKRFDDNIIKTLNKIRWWDWSEEKIKQNKLLFQDELTLEKLHNLA